MKLARWLLLVMVAAVACSPIASTMTDPVPVETELSITETLPPPPVRTTQVPDPAEAVEDYMQLWMDDDYPAMYAMLTSISQDAIDEEEFTKWYTSVLAEVAAAEVDHDILSSFIRNSKSAQVGYRITLHSVLVGDITRETIMNLTLEDGSWRVQWADDLVLPELANGNYLWMDRHIPSRANIYDREGNAIVAYADAVSVGLIPGQIDPDTEEDVLSAVQWITGYHPDTVFRLYEQFPAGVDWYVPLGEALQDNIKSRYDVSQGYNFNGLLMYPYSSRYYYNNGVAPHAAGYVSLIHEDELDYYLRQGYNQDEKVGRQGIESWGEPYLGGKRGGTLYVINPSGDVVTILADEEAEPSQSIYTTLDKDLQLGAQQALLKYRGAIVVLERETGRVLAMASSPGFNPNAFEYTNFNSNDELAEIFAADAGQPTLNRATQGQYPLGSVFKIITMAAALESGQYTPDTIYECGYDFKEIQGLTLYDWTYDHYLEDGKTESSGILTLEEGLMRSCNPYFWHIGLDLYNEDLKTAVSDMARGFGLGEVTGIEGVDEESGQIPDPESEVDATNLAIGQGASLVTPLQVAQFVAAVGNDGVMYRPQLIERIAPPDGEPTMEFAPDEIRTLPVSEANLASIQRAMQTVINNRRGTAYYVLNGFSSSYNIPIAGKTGTAESGSGESHAWFAGYTFANREYQPDIAVVVIAENAGEGSEVAAPIFKAMVHLYYYGEPRSSLPWEERPGVLATPEPEEEEEVEQP